MASVNREGCNIVQNHILFRMSKHRKGASKSSQHKNWSYYTKYKFYIIQGSKIAKNGGCVRFWRMYLLKCRIRSISWSSQLFYFRNLYTKRKNYAIIISLITIVEFIVLIFLSRCFAASQVSLLLVFVQYALHVCI